MTADLAHRILAEANMTGGDRERFFGTSRDMGLQALNFVYAAMVGYQVHPGDNPLRAVNIETLISALRMLQHRETHEAAPFVAAWRPGASGFGMGGPTVWDAQELRSALAREVKAIIKGETEPNVNRLAQIVAVVAQRAMNVESPGAFSDAERFVLQSLRRQLNDLKDVAYLQPICDLALSQAGGLDVISLNYDLALQCAAGEASVPVDIGINRWAPGRPLSFETIGHPLRLIKVHGSIDWAEDRAHQGGMIGRDGLWRHSPLVAPPAITVGQGWDDDDPYSRPWIVVGDRDKLATDGPVLPLLHSAFEALHRASRLIVVGYSFSDGHINAMIRDWMFADEKHTITVVDPGWRLEPGWTDPRQDYLDAWGHLPLGHNQSGLSKPRLSLISKFARDGLAEALNEP